MQASILPPPGSVCVCAHQSMRMCMHPGGRPARDSARGAAGQQRAAGAAGRGAVAGAVDSQWITKAGRVPGTFV